MVEMGTFVAILLGNVVGGLLIAVPTVGAHQVAVAGVLLALAGRAVAQWVPASPATDATLKIHWNPFSETLRNLKLARGNRVVFRSLLGISWMWFFGAVFLANFPAFAKDVLHGNEQVASLLLVVFSVGIGTGSLLCESAEPAPCGDRPGAAGRDRHEPVLDRPLRRLAFGLPPSPTQLTHGAVRRHQPAHWRVMADLFAALALRRPLQRADVRADPGCAASPRTAPASSPPTTS